MAQDFENIQQGEPRLPRSLMRMMIGSHVSNFVHLERDEVAPSVFPDLAFNTLEADSTASRIVRFRGQVALISMELTHLERLKESLPEHKDAMAFLDRNGLTVGLLPEGISFTDSVIEEYPDRRYIGVVLSNESIAVTPGIYKPDDKFYRPAGAEALHGLYDLEAMPGSLPKVPVF